jgi:hypothetical protein
MFGAPDAYASQQAVDNLLRYLKPDAFIVAFGAKFTRRFPGRALNLPFRCLMRLSFSSTPALNDEPWAVLADRLAQVHVHEYFLGCMFLAWGSGRRSR